MRNGWSASAVISEPALPDEDSIAGAKCCRGRDDEANRAGNIDVGQGDAVAPGAWGEASSDRDSALDAHIGHIRILPRGGDFAQDEKGPIGLDLHRDRWITDIPAA